MKIYKNKLEEDLEKEPSRICYLGLGLVSGGIFALTFGSFLYPALYIPRKIILEDLDKNGKLDIKIESVVEERIFLDKELENRIKEPTLF